MDAAIIRGLRRAAHWLLIGTAGAVGAVLATSSPASAATTATFTNGVLTVFGDNRANTITVSSDAAGTILVNNGAIAVSGGTPSVANTRLIQAFGLGANDVISLDEINGALPRANLFGGIGNDTLRGGSGGDLLFGLAGDDTLEARGGRDLLFGGNGKDKLTGGDSDDQAFGESGDDTLIWNPGDDTDLNEGGGGIDTVQVNGGTGAEVFTTTANANRVRFDRIDPAPFAIDIGTSENLVLNANGGDDRFSATGNLAALIRTKVEGGAGNDTILGSNGADVLLGGDNNDFVDGQQGDDVAFLGGGDDSFQWDPGDGSDVVEGQTDSDTMVFNGSGGDEIFEAAANGQRLRFTRSLGNIVMDIDDVEAVDLNALGGADTITVNDLAATDVAGFDGDLAGVLGGSAGDAQPDTVIVNGTDGLDNVDVAGTGTSVSVAGLVTQVNVTNSEGANDSLVVNARGGGDVVEATTLAAGLIELTIDGGAGDDQLRGSQGVDRFLGGDNDDNIFGDNGNDVALMGNGDDVFQWDPGDGNDTLEGQAGTDTMLFVGANAAENIDIAANGGRVRFFRNVANVTMDLNDVEAIDFLALGGADTIVVNDLPGTDVSQVDANLAGAGGGGDAQPDTVIVNATNGDDVVLVTGDAAGTSVLGLSAQVNMTGAEAANDRLTVNALAGDDVVEASGLQSGAIQLTADGGDGNDVLIGGEGNDVLLGGPGDDVLLGGGGTDVIDGGDGDDIEIQLVAPSGENRLTAASGDRVSSATPADAEWLRSHVRIVNGQTVIIIDGREYGLSNIDLSDLVDAAAAVASSEPPTSSEPETSEAPGLPIGDFIWLDADGDGLQDAGEAGLPNVLVRLLDAGGAVVGEGVTAESGRYELTPTSPGPFTVEVVLPAGYQPTLVDAGQDDAIDSDADPAKVVVGPVETAVRVDVGDAAGVEDDFDVGLVALPAQPPAPDTTTSAPTTTAPTAVETPTTTQPTTTAVPTTEPQTTAGLAEPAEPVTGVPAEVSPTTEATTSTSAPAG